MYKLMMYASLDIKCIYQCVVLHQQVPESKLSKKHHLIAYHVVREGVSRREWLTGYIKSEYNPSDTLTKAIPSGEKRDPLVGCYLHHVS